MQGLSQLAGRERLACRPVIRHLAVLVHSGASGQGGNIRLFRPLVNNGTISADASGKTIAISSTGPLTNNGTLSFGANTLSGGSALVLGASGTVNGNGTNLLVSAVGTNVNGGTSATAKREATMAAPTCTPVAAPAASARFITRAPRFR